MIPCCHRCLRHLWRFNRTATAGRKASSRARPTVNPRHRPLSMSSLPRTALQHARAGGHLSGPELLTARSAWHDRDPPIARMQLPFTAGTQARRHSRGACLAGGRLRQRNTQIQRSGCPVSVAPRARQPQERTPLSRKGLTKGDVSARRRQQRQGRAVISMAVADAPVLDSATNVEQRTTGAQQQQPLPTSIHGPASRCLPCIVQMRCSRACHLPVHKTVCSIQCFRMVLELVANAHSARRTGERCTVPSQCILRAGAAVPSHFIGRLEHRHHSQRCNLSFYHAHLHSTGGKVHFQAMLGQ